MRILEYSFILFTYNVNIHIYKIYVVFSALTNFITNMRKIIYKILKSIIRLVEEKRNLFLLKKIMSLYLIVSNIFWLKYFEIIIKIYSFLSQNIFSGSFLNSLHNLNFILSNISQYTRGNVLAIVYNWEKIKNKRTFFKTKKSFFYFNFFKTFGMKNQF